MRLKLTALLIVLAFSVNAQNYSWEVGGGVGSSNYFGDIGGTSKNGKKGPADIMLETTSLNFAAFTRRMIDYRFYANFQLSYIHIHGDDARSPNTGRTTRNLAFTNDMIEAIAMLEFHPLIINDLGGKRRHVADLHVLLSTGVGAVYSNPKDAGGASLRPLQTEGPSQKYNQVQVVIPLAIGTFISFKGRYSSYKVHRIGFTVNYRVTFTDYLDDVSTVYPDPAVFEGRPAALAASYKGYSDDPDDPNIYPEGGTRGNPNSNDGYLTAMIYYSKRINVGKKRHKLPRRQEFYGRTRKMKIR